MFELDRELKLELMDSFIDLYEDIENTLSEIAQHSSDELLKELFRSIHTVKGNAGICGLRGIADYTHSLEEIAESLRSFKFELTPAIRDTLQLGMDRLKDLHERELKGIHFDNLHEEKLAELFHAIAVADQYHVDEEAKKLIEFMASGVVLDDSDVEPITLSTLSSEQINREISIHVDDYKLQSDLFFFQEISALKDLKFEIWNSKSIQLFDWSHQMNEIAGNVVNYEQLSAAIYMHDIGLSYLPDHFLIDDAELSQQDRELVLQHPIIAFNHLSKIPGWEEAAKIALQYKEHINGSGYPNGITSDEMHPGAKILSIVTQFFNLTNGAVDKTKRHSVVRAISQINSGIDSLYDGMWVQCFNHMIRKELKSGSI